MDPSLKALEGLGERVALTLDEALPERELAIDRARRGYAEWQRARVAGFRLLNARAIWAGGLGAAVLAGAMLVLSQRSPRALTFNVDGATGTLKSWLAAPENSALRLRFSEGTQVRLEAASRARVVDIDSHGASLALESGRLHADVVHQRGAVWKVVAGPFTVNVKGTVFDVNWDPNSEQLRVSVSRGVVAVRESSTGAEQDVHASETLSTTVAQHHFDVTHAGAEPEAALVKPVPAALPGDPPSTPELLIPDLRDAVNAASDERIKAAPAKAEAVADWREFAKHGALREAFASAKGAGFASVCASASPAELLSLGDGARLSGKSDDANLALLTLRRRYPSDPRRAAAAFSLGKVAFDQRRAFEQAAEWFSTSLREQPGGPLAREASGRLIEASSRAGDTVGAQRAARDYLKKYPEGPHADLARSVLR